MLECRRASTPTGGLSTSFSAGAGVVCDVDQVAADVPEID
jgi:hypothetical protein